MYHYTESVLGTTIITAALGVSQGSPTSCLSFVIFLNDLIMFMKQGCDRDGVSQWLNIRTSVMDDTAILVTSKQNLVKNLTILHDYCMV